METLTIRHFPEEMEQLPVDPENLNRVLLSGLFVPSSPQQEELGQLLLTEVLTLALGRQYTYALYEPL